MATTAKSRRMAITPKAIYHGLFSFITEISFFIRTLPMGDADHEHKQLFLFNFIQNAIWPDTKRPNPLKFPREFLANKRIFFKSIESHLNPFFLFWCDSIEFFLRLRLQNEVVCHTYVFPDGILSTSHSFPAHSLCARLQSLQEA